MRLPGQLACLFPLASLALVACGDDDASSSNGAGAQPTGGSSAGGSGAGGSGAGGAGAGGTGDFLFAHSKP